jgi:hypothetical protein
MKFLNLRRLILRVLMLTAMSAVAPISAQSPDDFTGREGMPKVEIIDNAVGLQASLYPEWYRTHSVGSDMRWLHDSDTALTNFWNTNGTLILATLSEYSGIRWVEREFDIYLVRYYYTSGDGDPAILPLGGIRRGHLATAMPTGAHQQFNLIFQLARRMLGQLDRTAEAGRHPAAAHPLMQPGPYRRDNLAMLLALVISQQVLGIDSTYLAYQSGFWKNNHPGREIFEQYLLKDWILTPERPLVTWVNAEPYGSVLVQATRPPRRRPTATVERAYLEGLPTKGELGFSTRIDSRGRLLIEKIDPTRLSYASGLQEGDIVRSVNGSRVRNQKELVEQILAGLDRRGATLDILRDNNPMMVVIQAMDLADPDALFLYDAAEDSVYNASPDQDGN